MTLQIIDRLRATSVEAQQRKPSAALVARSLQAAGFGVAQRSAIVEALQEAGLVGLDDAQFHASAAEEQRQSTSRRLAEGEAKRLGLSIKDGRVDLHELNSVLASSGKTPEQRMQIRCLLASASLID